MDIQMPIYLEMKADEALVDIINHIDALEFLDEKQAKN
jgi:hypothetical protein